jgi:cytochrome c-type biogenesis protein
MRPKILVRQRGGNVQYLIVFLEGLITFVSPCLLPMLPVYVSYFAAERSQSSVSKTLLRAVAFVLGFTIVFLLLGLFAGTLGGLFVRHRAAVNVVMGAVIILFALGFLGIVHLPFFGIGKGGNKEEKRRGFFPALVFGMVFSLSFTPCIGAFLGAALAMASQQGSALAGALMLLAYSAGLGIPFILSAVLIDSLKTTLDWIKRHYKTINIASGIFLLIVGVAMMTGLFDALLALFR